MATTAQIAANRQNALKSTGPKSPEGKNTAAQNSLKHGLSARQVVIRSEDQAEFDLYRQQFLEELAPDTPLESMLAERVVNLSWRLIRAGRIQTQTIDAMSNPDKSPLMDKLNVYLESRGCENQPQSPELELGNLAIKDFSNDRVLDRLLMYERRLENSLYKTVLELQRLNLMKNLKTNRNILADYAKQTQYA